MDALPTRTPLVGRAGETDFLLARLEAAWHGQGPRFVLIGGAAGVGKTRLMEELGEHATRQSWRVLHGHYLREVVTPHGAWKEALRPAADEIAGLSVAAVDLALVFPERADATLRFDLMIDANDRRARYAEAVAGLTATLARHHPLLLLLDDLQWASDVLPLVLLTASPQALQLLVVGTMRTDELVAHQAMSRDLHELNRVRQLTELSLPCLDDHDTTAMVAHHVGAELARDLADVMYATTRGNPYFVEEVLRSLVDDGVMQSHVDGWVLTAERPEKLQLPESVCALIEHRIDRLGEGTRATLDRAAVLGQEFSFRLLQAMSGQADHEVVAHVERALQARLIVDCSSPREERYGFIDDRCKRCCTNR
jgi:predicted ATPase